jgi:type III restriction enzyme
MLKEIKDLQSNKVFELIQKFHKQNEITFKAPTGSGKTFMMADFMNQILTDSSFVFVVSTLSKAGLGKQNFDKFVEYSNKFSNLNPYLINSESAQEEKIHIPNDYNVYVLPRDLYKDKSRIKDSSAFLSLLVNLKLMAKTIVLIRDESHIATNNLDDLGDYFEKTINFSATPKFSPDVEITNEEAIRVKLIKRLAEVKKEKDEDDGNFFSIWENDSVEEAVRKFIEVKKDYINLLKVNPCLIIQISNKEKAEEEWNSLKKIIDDPNKNLKWMYIVDENAGSGSDTNDDVKKLPVSKWKDYVKNNESLIDVIIFKMVITEGWDIPRACMLYQIRDSKSKQMDEQVIGRVRRNPILLKWENFNDYAQKLALTCWVWGIVDNNLRNFKKVKLVKGRNFFTKTTKLLTIERQNNFNLDYFIQSRPLISSPKSIFELNRLWNKISPETEVMVWKNIKTPMDWQKYSNFIEEIEKENMAFMADYELSLQVDGEESFQQSSYFELTNIKADIDDWNWRMNDKNDDEYHFDSEAEKEFAKILRKLKIKFWGKNFYPNSTIKFEYVLYKKYNSFPDFIAKDKNDKIHVFEVKSFDKGNTLIDSQEYINKVSELMKMFKVASKKTGQFFYVPIREKGVWLVNMFVDGNHSKLSEDQFKAYFQTVT